MRKSLLLTILLLVLAAGFFYDAADWVAQGKDAVAIEETVLYGDKAAAEGLVVDSFVQCDYRLFWHTRYQVGAVPACDTDFRFSQTEDRSSSEYPYRGIYFTSVFEGFGVSGSLDMTEESLLLQDVASRTLPGEEHTEVVSVGAYYQYYPIRVDFDRPCGFAVNEDIQKLFAGYFQFPVLANHRITVTVGKNEAGEVYQLQQDSFADSGVSLDGSSVATEDACFFTVCYTAIADGMLLDTGAIPGGYGIYRFPVDKESEETRVLTKDDLQTVYAVDPAQVRIISLQLSLDQSKLLLVTLEEGLYQLTVLDAATATPLQKLPLLPAVTDVVFDRLVLADDFIVAFWSDGRFALLSADEAGRYQVGFNGDLRAREDLHYLFSGTLGMDFHDGRLAMAVFADGWYSAQEYCSFYLVVYDKTGLLYEGKYGHSLDKSPVADNYAYTCRPVDDTPLAVTWGR